MGCFRLRAFCTRFVCGFLEIGRIVPGGLGLSQTMVSLTYVCKKGVPNIDASTPPLRGERATPILHRVFQRARRQCMFQSFCPAANVTLPPSLSLSLSLSMYIYMCNASTCCHRHFWIRLLRPDSQDSNPFRPDLARSRSNIATSGPAGQEDEPHVG